MPQVRAAIAAKQLDPAHAKTVIRALNNVGFIEFGVETGPATTGIEFTVRAKQRVATTYTMIMPPLPALIVFTSERRFGACLPGYAELLRCQLFLPLLLGLAYFSHAGILPK